MEGERRVTFCFIWTLDASTKRKSEKNIKKSIIKNLTFYTEVFNNNYHDLLKKTEKNEEDSKKKKGRRGQEK